MQFIVAQTLLHTGRDISHPTESPVNNSTRLAQRLDPTNSRASPIRRIRQHIQKPLVILPALSEDVALIVIVKFFV